MKKEALAITAFLAIAVVASIVFAEDPNNHTNVDLPKALLASASSTNPATGLTFTLSLNATTIRSGQAVNFSASEHSTLGVRNNVSGSSSWPLKDLGLGPCKVDQPFGIAVYRGYQTKSNVSSASAVYLYRPGTYHCPMVLSGLSQYSFYPNGSMAQILGACASGPCPIQRGPHSIAVKGYWNSTVASSYTDFPPGIYTMSAGDEWGQLVLLYFMVKA